ncbi:MAG: PolC-type DNA polymerase III, partial [Bacilli bacterium]
VETTGLSARYDTIIELAAIKVTAGELGERFEQFANPGHPLSLTTIELTGITDEMVKDADTPEQLLRDFFEWSQGCTLVAHNATFDVGFLREGYRRYNIGTVNQPSIDTLEMARTLMPEMKNHRLNTVCKKLGIELTQHHRAIYDTEATAHVFLKFMKEIEKREAVTLRDLNGLIDTETAYQRSRPTHMTVLAKNETGLKNLFKLISLSHIRYFYRTARVPKHLLEELREGLLIGSACSEGEVFEAAMQKGDDDIRQAMQFYDYIEVHPPAYYMPLVKRELIGSEAVVKEIIQKIITIAKEEGKTVVATGNVHYIDPDEHMYRDILLRANNLRRISHPPEAHFYTTEQMLNAFDFLPKDVREEVVIHNTHLIAEQIENIKVIRDDLYTPKIEGADDEVRDMSYRMARSLYGEELPEIVEARLEKELKSIIGHGFAVIYLISHKLVKKSLDDGYLVGSRGSVGSSFVATMMEITEVNPLAPHYRCKNCKHSVFFADGSVSSGYDLADAVCEKCGTPYVKDGQDIPFETFLGFKGDKVPDIDLNFSGDYQPHAHNYTKVLFGEDYVYRAGTIGTIADKTAFGYVKGYLEDANKTCRNVEIERLATGFTGVKRTTGQHPGGIIVVPDYMDIYDFCPIQYPADSVTAEWRTTHFDFHSIHDNLLKLDILGHDDPTVIRMLQDLSGIDPKTIPTDDPDVMSIFSSPRILGVTEEQIGSTTGTLGIPEFGTKFVRGMLEETKPKSFSELVQISGLSHGTDVWLYNANELIANGTCVLSEVIGCRDDIMVYLIYKGLEPSLAFKIMESVRKGKGLVPEWEDDMRANDVPQWYIDSCKKIKYMFPKAHASAYVLMAVRIAYFKVHHPILYYAAYFSVRADDFEIDVMTKGSQAIRARIHEINEKGFDASPKERNLVTVLEIALEMTERGYSFSGIDLYRSDSTNFLIDGHKLIMPFRAIAGLGDNVANAIVRAREGGEYLSKEDFQKRTRISKTLFEYLDAAGCFGDLPDANQLSLF